MPDDLPLGEGLKALPDQGAVRVGGRRDGAFRVVDTELESGRFKDSRDAGRELRQRLRKHKASSVEIETLLARFEHKARLIYIAPPFASGQMFESLRARTITDLAGETRRRARSALPIFSISPGSRECCSSKRTASAPGSYPIIVKVSN